ncbi:hypothetical protein ElP_72910 (plasmid) [Tautonia plasticadhaerens]|uniref:Recombinase n=1 Tax=Tautonia plasticadhaerens TaxID=2527974 RepID=A0A518HEX9_9BACT|nr:recombinase family protein [Tautonia plasticadhaerens]QDV39326.1 hypothetical protein ElP_72910 [Tautonia plasticadhaerens]
MTDPPRSSKIRSWHLDRSAFVYVRQSAPQQVADHQESTARPYALADRAVELGWPRERITIVDDDLGRSGQSVEGRPGFQRLLAEVALDRVGLILGLEASRLARSCRDWHQLLELCARFRTLLADADGLYDPTDHDDRLLPGLHGMMSEAELHILKERMYQGKLNKARRGALRGIPPIGYIRLASAEWAIDPDEQVQATVRLIFDQFDRESTSHGLLRYLVHHTVRIPVRPGHGPNRGELGWRRPNRATLQNLPHHPAYAGADRFGHRPVDPRRKQPGRPNTGRLIRRPEDCLVLIRGRLPAYITWDRFRSNRDRLAANRARCDGPGAPRQGPSLLAGLLRCGRCGRRMIVRYSGPKGRQGYICTRGTADYAEPLCQCLSGAVIGDLVRKQILAAVEPAALEASLAAAAEVERERAELARHWQLRRVRVRYEAERAARQYQACEPENRLVGRALERRWEEALEAQRQVDDESGLWQRSAPGRLAPDDEAAIRALAADLPAVWEAATASPAERQRIARLLIEQVCVTVDKASERVDVELRWVGGLVQSHTPDRPVTRYDLRSEYPRLVERLRSLCRERLSSAAIAERLNAEGFHPPKRTDRFTGGMVLRLTSRLGLERRQRHGSASGLGRDEYRSMGLARRLGMPRDTVRRWLRAGWLTVRRDAEGHHVIWADAAELRRLRELHRLPRTWASKGRLAGLLSPALPKRQGLQPEWDPGVADERGQQVRSLPQGRGLVPQPEPELSGVLGRIARQSRVLGVAPHPFVRIRIRGVAGEVLGLDPRMLGLVRLHHPRPLMDPAPVPEDRHRPPEPAPGPGQEGDRVLPVGVGVVRQQPEDEVGPPEHRADGHGADRRDPALAMPRPLDRGLSPGGVGAAGHRLERGPRLVEEDESGLPLLGPLDDPGRHLGPSAGDPLLVALLGPPLRLLAGPVQPPSDELAGVLDVVGDAEAAADDLGDPLGTPRVVGPAVGPGPPRQQVLELPEPLVGGPGRRAGMRLGGQGLGGVLGHAEPAIQRGTADAEDASDDGGGLALLHQFDGSATAAFQFVWIVHPGFCKFPARLGEGSA